MRIASAERGFTLVELLVVILIIGILAAIALPIFLGQQQKGQDASAKSDARNMVSQVESCFADQQDYTKCTPTGNSINGSPTGLNVGPAQGQVTMSATDATDYAVTGFSKSGNNFTITKSAATGTTRTCTTTGQGSCPSSGTW